MSNEIEIALFFKDDPTDPLIVRDQELIKKIPVLNKLVFDKDPDSESTTTPNDFTTVLRIPHSKFAGEFIVEYGLKYSSPSRSYEKPNLDDYKEANEKTLKELREILECTCFLGFLTFMECITYVLEQKFKDLPFEDFAEFCGRGKRNLGN